jgi:prepilin-type N-terminal cleavage/methylation domain-containing protein
MEEIIKKAFTLIELLVVIAIIGILSGLIIVGMNGMSQKANLAKAQVFSNSLRNSLMMRIVAEWKIDNVSGTVDSSLADGTLVSDSWKTNNCLTSGGPTLRDLNNCMFGKCLSFDGTNDYLSCADDATLNSTELTVSVWVKSTKNTATYQQGIVAKANLSGTEFGWILRKYTDNKFEFAAGYSYPRNHHLTYSDIAYTDNNWHYIVGVNVPGVANYIYVDGVKQTASESGTTFVPTAQPVTIGTAYGDMPLYATYHERFGGFIDDVRIYNTVIPTSQIKEQYYIGLNKLFINGSISQLEYLERIKNETAQK